MALFHGSQVLLIISSNWTEEVSSYFFGKRNPASPSVSRIDIWHVIALIYASPKAVHRLIDAGVVMVPGKHTEESDKEQLFQKRLAERLESQNQFMWSLKEIPSFQIPREQSKLFADRYIEDPNLSDEEVERRALLDLTSFNFWTLFKRVHYEFRRAQRYGRPLSVLMVCIDHLQAVTTTLGLHAENTVILTTGKQLLSCLRDVDIAGRCRDDTFGVILPETPLSGAQIAAERIRTRIENMLIPFELSSFTATVTVSGSAIPGSAQAVDQLIGEAVQLLQKGIANGGNTVMFPPATPGEQP